MNKIYILSGKIKSGKTTELFRWISGRKKVGGILQPVVDGKRFFYSVTEKKLIQLEISNMNDKSELGENKILQIGNYSFLVEGFERAKEILKNDFNSNYEWLIIDEIGPLELQDSGLEPVVSCIVEKVKTSSSKLIFVVRDSILQEVIKKYNLQNNWIDFGEIKDLDRNIKSSI